MLHVSVLLFQKVSSGCIPAAAFFLIVFFYYYAAAVHSLWYGRYFNTCIEIMYSVV